MIKLIQQIYGFFSKSTHRVFRVSRFFVLYHLSECFPRAMRGLYYFTQLLRCLTHTGVGVSPIQVSVSHPYTLRYLTHRTFRNHLVLRTAFLLCSG